MSLPSISRPLRTVLVWQLLVTAASSAIAGVLGGRHAALSAALGGGINVVAGLVYAALLVVGTAGGRARGAPVALMAAFRAEAGKVLAIIAQLWLVLSIYGNVVPVAFFPVFVVTVIVFSMAIFVRE